MMQSRILILLTCALSLLISCKEKMEKEEVENIGTTPCQRQPAFLKSTGIDPKRAAFSTSENRQKGLVLIQLPQSMADTANRKTWADSSWSKFGYMGPITTDENGNIYTAPTPVISILNNQTDKQNIVYKVDYRTAAMAPLIDLPMEEKPTTQNPFGLLGLFYDCHAQKLYASSVAASTRANERGIIYAIDPANASILDKLTGRDALGLCISGVSGQKRLYFGSSRTSNIYSIELTKTGKFTGEVKEELSLDMLGPRGDDKARKIRFDKNGDLVIFGVEFNYNLTAPTEKQETLYRFRYNPDEKKWNYIP